MYHLFLILTHSTDLLVHYFLKEKIFVWNPNFTTIDVKIVENSRFGFF